MELSIITSPAISMHHFLHWNLTHGAGKKLEDICPSTHNMEVPNVVRKDYMLIGMEDGFLSLMDDSGETRDDLKCPEDSIGDEIKKAIADEIDILVCGVKHPHQKFTHLCPSLLIIDYHRHSKCQRHLKLSSSVLC